MVAHRGRQRELRLLELTLRRVILEQAEETAAARAGLLAGLLTPETQPLSRAIDLARMALEEFSDVAA